LSSHLEELAAHEKVLKLMAEDPQLAPFGLCALDIRSIREATVGQVRAFFDPDEEDPQLGYAHVRLTGCHVPQIQGVLASLAVLIKSPTEPLR